MLTQNNKKQNNQIDISIADIVYIYIFIYTVYTIYNLVSM